MRRLLPLTVLALTCRSPIVNPNAGHFSCATVTDCGSGYECIAQFAGGKLCFKEGECTPEQCNGLDDNCDGRTDETFPEENMACVTGQPGPCSPGKQQCVDAGIACVRTYVPHAETCNGIDDDCTNGVDDGFNFAIDSLNCGRCGNACLTGATCAAATCRETSCSDGIDNDLDGGTDCEDPFCVTRPCDAVDAGNCGAALRANDAGTLDAGEDDGGFDAGELDAGFTVVPLCVPRESLCGDALDDDLDGRPDCADEDCAGLACDGGLCMMGTCQ